MQWNSVLNIYSCKIHLICSNKQENTRATCPLLLLLFVGIVPLHQCLDESYKSDVMFFFVQVQVHFLAFSATSSFPPSHLTTVSKGTFLSNCVLNVHLLFNKNKTTICNAAGNDIVRPVNNCILAASSEDHWFYLASFV